jgi:fatty acid desaturase
MFPMVPYHALPRLHEAIKHDLPVPDPSMPVAYARMIRALWRQRREPGYTMTPVLPPTARPFRPDLHQHVPTREGAA